MKDRLPLFIMVDACGWEILKSAPFCEGLAPTRKRLDSVFGYSSTCVPSILSGRWPDQHRNWCYFVHDPAHSPFRNLRHLRWLPTALTGRRIVRRMLTKLMKRQLGFKGYFDLYNVPFRHISQFDFTEKKSPLQPGGMNRGKNIFDHLVERQIPYFVSDPAQSEEFNRDELIRHIQAEDIDFAFQYWAGLDGLLHRVGNDSAEVPAKLKIYERWIGQVMEAAKDHYREVALYVFSDHGMANCDHLLDLRSRIQALDLKMGVDYSVIYDSTMARFWFLREGVRERVEAVLNTVSEGRVLPDQELAQMRTLFPDRYFGELIFLVREGVLIVPSDMGERPIRAMHGYHPTDPQSYAAFMTNQESIPESLTAIPHIFHVMTGELDKVAGTRLAQHLAPTTAAL